jgi:hypothetical protein
MNKDGTETSNRKENGGKCIQGTTDDDKAVVKRERVCIHTWTRTYKTLTE